MVDFCINQNSSRSQHSEEMEGKRVHHVSIYRGEGTVKGKHQGLAKYQRPANPLLPMGQGQRERALTPSFCETLRQFLSRRTWSLPNHSSGERAGRLNTTSLFLRGSPSHWSNLLVIARGSGSELIQSLEVSLLDTEQSKREKVDLEGQTENVYHTFHLELWYFYWNKILGFLGKVSPSKMKRSAPRRIQKAKFMKQEEFQGILEFLFFILWLRYTDVYLF